MNGEKVDVSGYQGYEPFPNRPSDVLRRGIAVGTIQRFERYRLHEPVTKEVVSQYFSKKYAEDMGDLERQRREFESETITGSANEKKLAELTAAMMAVALNVSAYRFARRILWLIEERGAPRCTYEDVWALVSEAFYIIPEDEWGEVLMMDSADAIMEYLDEELEDQFEDDLLEITLETIEKRKKILQS